MKRTTLVNCICVVICLVAFIGFMTNAEAPTGFYVVTIVIVIGMLLWNNSKPQVLEAEKDSFRIVEFIGKFYVEQYVDDGGFTEYYRWCSYSGKCFDTLEDATIFVDKAKKGRVIHQIVKHTDRKIIYHGGCHDCSSQELFGRERCVGCQYHKANWDLPNLNTSEQFEDDEEV